LSGDHAVALSTAEKNSQEVLYYKKDVAGKNSSELLPHIVDRWLKSLNFGKSMRWGSLQESFIRPIRWVNTQLGDELVPMHIYGVESAKKTFVHRIANFDALGVADIKSYFETLKNGGVTLFQDMRALKITNDIQNIEKEQGVQVEIDHDLFEEVVAITENPTALLGSFDSKSAV